MERDRMANLVTALRNDPDIARKNSYRPAVTTAYDDIRDRYDEDVFLEARVATLIGNVDVQLPHSPDHHLDRADDEEAAFYETLRHEESGRAETETWFDRHLDRALPDLLAYDDEAVAAWYDQTVDELDRRGYDGQALVEEITVLGARLNEQ